MLDKLYDFSKTNYFRILVVMTYFTTWFFFGIIYNNISKATKGRAFVFNKEAEVQSKIETIKRKINNKLDERVLYNLLSKEKIFIPSYKYVAMSPYS